MSLFVRMELEYIGIQYCRMVMFVCMELEAKFLRMWTLHWNLIVAWGTSKISGRLLCKGVDRNDCYVCI